MHHLKLFACWYLQLFQQYQEAFAKIPNIQIITEPNDSHSNFWLQTLLLNESIENQRDDILLATNDAGCMTRPIWKLLNQLKPYQKCQSMELPIAESLSRRLINLPSSPQIMMEK